MTADPWAVALEYKAVAHAATRRHRVPGQERADLSQMGMLALRKAAIGFDPARGVKFETYAWWKIAAAVSEARRRASRWGREAPGADDAAEPAAPEAPAALAADGRAKLLAAVAALTPRQSAVIRARFGLDGGGRRTLREACAELGMARSSVAWAEKRALRTLAAILGDDFDG